MSTQPASFKQIVLTIGGLLCLLASATVFHSLFDGTLDSVPVLIFLLCFNGIVSWAGIFMLGLRRFPLSYSITPTLLLCAGLYVVVKPVVENTAAQSKIAAAEVTKFNLLLINRMMNPEQLKLLTADELKPLSTGHMGVLEGYLKKVLGDFYQLQLEQQRVSAGALDALLNPVLLAEEQGIIRAQANLEKLKAITTNTNTKTQELLINTKAEASLLDVPDAIRKDFTHSFFNGLEKRQEQLKISLDYETKMYNAIAKLYDVLAKYRKDWTIENEQFTFKTELAYRDFYTVQLELNQAVKEYQSYHARNIERAKRAQ